MIQGLLRLVFYFGFGVVCFRFVNRLLENMGKQPSLGRRVRRDAKVIDLCPQCGQMLDRFHHC